MKNAIIIITITASGLLSGFLSHNPQQLFLLIHLLIATFLIAIFYTDTKQHISEKKHTDSLSTVLSGSALLLLILICYSSALINVISFSKNISTILKIIHQYSAYLLIIFIITHLWKKTNYIASNIKTIKSKIYNRKLLLSVIILGLITGYSVLPINLNNYTVDSYSYTYGKNPFSPSLAKTEDQKFIHPNYFDNSSCIGCHKGIAKQWQSSAHRHAAADPFYVKNISLLADLKGIEATRYCEGCHAPAALLTGSLTPGGSHGGQKGNISNDIGVDCITCHSIDSSTNNEGNANYIFSIKKLGLSTAFNNKPLDNLSIASISLSSDTHINMMKNEFSSTSRYCSTCHSQFMDESMNNWGWVKMQDEYQAWLNSPYSHSNDPAFSQNEIATCQNCHMPLIKANDPAANAEGLVKSHKFLGANTALPFLRSDEPHLTDTIKFLSSNKLSMSFDIENRKQAIENSLHSNRSSKSHEIKPIYFYSGEILKANLIISNNGVGHNFPGGTIDLNEVWVEIDIKDANGSSLYSTGGLNTDSYLPSDNYAYKSIPVDQNGNPVWRHDLFNKTGEAYKNVIQPGKSDSIPIEAYIPQQAESPLILTAKLRYRKLNKRYSDWALNTEVNLPIINVSHTELTVNLIQRPPTIEK